ncbi:MAG: outer membrane protein assembly factor BamA [Gemmatimonadota bacterium]
MRLPVAWTLVAVAGTLVLAPPPARAQEPAAGPIVDSIEVVGNRRNTRETIVNTAALPVHAPVTYRDIQRALRAVFLTGQFDDVQLGRRSGANGSEILVITVRERPLLVRATVRGVVKLSERSVRDRIELPAGRPGNAALVERATQRIDSLYEAEGYYLASVRAILVPDDSDHVRIVYDVNEGRRVAIARVEMEGNERFADKDIVAHMRTRPEGFWWFQKGEYAEEQLREDIEQRLPAFYGSRGFIDFRVLDDTLIVDRDNGKATLQITVEEGQPYLIGRVAVEGNRRFSTEEVLTLNPFGNSAGAGDACPTGGCAAQRSWFDQTKWENATTRLRTQYWNQGYIYAQIEPRVDRIEAGDSLREPRVNLTWQIEEGRPAIVNRIEILGNEITHDRVIREAIVILPGDVFSQERVLRSYQNIGNLGFFQQPLPFPDTRPANEEGDIDLVFRVEERRTGNVNFGASVGQGTGVGGFLGLDEPNLFGMGKRGRLQWQFGKNINDFDISYTDPSVLGSRVSSTFSIHNTRIRYTVADLGRINTQGVSLQVGWPLPRSRYSRVFTSYSIERESYSGAAANLTGTFRCANCLRSTAGVSFMRDTRIDLPFATAGAMYNASAQFTGGVLGGSAAFQRYDLESRWYAPVGQLGPSGPASSGVRILIGLSAKAGFVFGDAGPFFRQLYAMGGTQYGIPLRGYDEFSITPRGFDPTATLGGVPRTAFGKSYFVATAEFGFRVSQMLYAAFFYDAGNVWSTASGFNPTRLFRGAGIGVSVVTPMGPLGLDYAYGFDRIGTDGRPAPGWKLHFKVGNFF